MIQFLIFLTVLTMTSSAHHNYFYRKDYTYIEEFDAFYKLHWDKVGVSYNTAFMACDDEGAQLFYPKQEREWTIVKNLTAFLDEATNTTDVLVGIHDEIGMGDFVTVDGQSTPMPLLEDQSVGQHQDCAIMDMETGTYKIEPCIIDPWTRRLFACKKVDEKPCPTIDLGYKYAEEIRKCYKVNKRQRTWKEAFHTCYMEEGLLAMPENDAEARYVYRIVEDAKNYFAGFRKIFNGSDFYTIKGQKLDKLSFQRWHDQSAESNNDCGGIFTNYPLYLSARPCHDTLPFVCEMKANTLLTIASPRHNHFYRKDYTYIEEFDAFYKLHWDKDGVSYNTAFMACDDEGAQLFYPKQEGEWTIVKNLTAFLDEAPDTTDVLVGIHDVIGLGEFVTVDGQSTSMPLLEDQSVGQDQNCAIMDMETGTYKLEPCLIDPLIRRLFACKKVDEKPCPTIDLDYKYAEEIRKCYKVNKRQRTWQEAWHTCYMEGGLLAMPENDAEAKFILFNMVVGHKTYFAGFRKVFNGSDFYTVKGKKLDELRFQRWYERSAESNNDCGGIYATSPLSLRTRPCHDTLPFICEMKANM